MSMVFFNAQPTFRTPQEEIQFLRQKIEQQNAEFQRLQKTPLASATVIAVDGSKCNIAVGNNVMEVETPKSFDVTPATRVHIRPDSHQIVDVIKEPFLMGMTTVVDEVIDDKHATTNAPGMGSKLVIFHGDPPKPGDKVVLAPGGYFLALEKLKDRLKKGSKLSISLQFEKAGKVDVAFDVLSPASKGPVAPKAADDGNAKK